MHPISKEIFFDTPSSLKVDKNDRYTIPAKINDLVIELKNVNCPLIAFGLFSPSSFEPSTSCLRRKWNNGLETYWKDIQVSHATYVIILGAAESDVYYALAEEESSSYVPSKVDKKIYVLSFEKFRESLTLIYPPLPEPKMKYSPGCLFLFSPGSLNLLASHSFQERGKLKLD